ncbi:hypothetical protein Tco_0030472, partial [Tanacetum coccineum]
MLFTEKQLVMNPDSSESLVGNATYWNGMLDMAWISSGLPALAGGHLSDAFTVWFQLEDNIEGNVAKRDCFPEQLLSKYFIFSFNDNDIPACNNQDIPKAESDRPPS